MQKVDKAFLSHWLAVFWDVLRKSVSARTTVDRKFGFICTEVYLKLMSSHSKFERFTKTPAIVLTKDGTDTI